MNTLVMRFKRLSFVAILLILAFAAAIGLAELVVRICVPESQWRVIDASEDWSPHPRLGWVQKSNYECVSRRRHGEVVRFRTNLDGCQPSEAKRARSDGTRRILLVGDSTIVGRSIHADGRLHTQLDKALATSGIEAESVNAGVEGYSTDQALIRMEMLLPLYRPDIVIHCVCANDFTGNSRATGAGLNKPLFVMADESGTLSEQTPAPNVKLRKLAKWPVTWLHGSALYGLARPRLLVWRARNKSFEHRNVLGLNDAIYYQPDAMNRIDWQIFTAILTRMNELTATYGARFMFYAVPDAMEVWPAWTEQRMQALGIPPASYDRFTLERKLAGIANNARIEFVPMIQHFIKNEDLGPFHLLPVDRHCNGKGYELTAHLLAQRIAAHTE